MLVFSKAAWSVAGKATIIKLDQCCKTTMTFLRWITSRTLTFFDGLGEGLGVGTGVTPVISSTLPSHLSCSIKSSLVVMLQPLAWTCFPTSNIHFKGYIKCYITRKNTTEKYNRRTHQHPHTRPWRLHDISPCNQAEQMAMVRKDKTETQFLRCTKLIY